MASYSNTYYVRESNKKLFSVFAPFLSFLIALIVIVGLLSITGYMDTHYTTTAEVYSIEDNSVILVDGAGYLWEVTNRTDLAKGDFVKIKFDNNCTDYTRNDDIILSVKRLDN